MINRNGKPLLMKVLILLVVLAGAGWIFSGTILSQLGQLIIVDETPPPSDAIVVLNTGIEYYPRLIEAADLYRKGLARHVVVNGNRKTDTLRELERKGFEPGCPWYDERVRILKLLGVPEDAIITISAEDAYDTVSEAEAVGSDMMQQGISSIIITTSKSHTRRARFIWKKLFGKKLDIAAVSAKSDPFDPNGWWKDGRQIRWVLAEYGAWVYYWWKAVKKI